MSSQPKPGASPTLKDCLAGGGKMGALMRSMDWSKTPIGPVETWSLALRMVVQLLLVNRFQLFLWWGPQFCQIYNDASWLILGEKHPNSMGQPASECWAEIWHIIGPLIRTPYQGGDSTWMDDILLEKNRSGFMQETHFTIAYSPVPDASVPGGIGGVLGTVHEITEKVVAERRVMVLRDLRARSTEAKTVEEACAIAGETLCQHAKDIPFALLYLVDADRKRARLAGHAGVDRAKAESPLLMELAPECRDQQIWPLPETLHDAFHVVEDLPRRLATVPPGPWSDPPQTAVALPIRSDLANHHPAGVLVLGISSRLRLDDRYKDFCELVSSQVATAIANARAYEERKKRAETLAEIDLLQDITPGKGAEEQPVMARNELEQRVSERTAQLLKSNEQLRREIAEREKVQAEAIALKEELAAELSAEEASRESEERFRRYFDLGLVGMAITSPTKACLEVNDELCRILGYEREELLHMIWAEMTYPDDLAADVASFNRVLAEEIDGYSMDKRWLRKDGRIIDTIMAAKCVRRSNGSVNYFVGLVQDITERKRAEEEQRKLAALVENSPDFIGLASLDGEVYIVNPAGRALVGLNDAAQATETRVLDYMAEEDRATFQQQIWPHVLREGAWEGETRFRHFKSGAIIPAREHIFLIKEPRTERPVAMAMIVRDITERKRAEEALRTAQEQLAHIARVTTMGELAASIAHEVSQPLTAVVTNGDAGLRWLSQSPPNVEEAQKAMTEMVRQGHRASEVIARIRTLLRKSKSNISTVNINELIGEVLALTRQKAEEHGVIVRVDVARDTPLISGDSVQLQQVLTNLILNALEATNAKKNGAREVLVTSQCQGTNEVVIAVHDAGTGIDPQHMDQLFRPFFTTKETGLGMGLAISRSIVEAHGGRLWATPKPERGTTFQFSLPIRGVF